MAILQPCLCGEVYNLKSEYAGKLLACAKCGSQLRAPLIDREKGKDSLKVFDNDIFLLRQNHFSISTKYLIKDNAGLEILFVQRPSKYLARMGLILLFIIIFTVVLSAAKAALIAPLLLIAYVFINVKRNIKFYDGRQKQRVLLEVKQQDWLQKKWIRYTLYDHNEAVLGYFEKNRFTDFLRRK